MIEKTGVIGDLDLPEKAEHKTEMERYQIAYCTVQKHQKDLWRGERQTSAGGRVRRRGTGTGDTRRLYCKPPQKLQRAKDVRWVLTVAPVVSFYLDILCVKPIWDETGNVGATIRCSGRLTAARHRVDAVGHLHLTLMMHPAAAIRSLRRTEVLDEPTQL